ncbi:hypothetical protein ACLOJK_006669 [Asimina triloba]
MEGSKGLRRRLEVVSPVPADIDIANSVEPLHISEIAKDLNLGPQHYDLYGKFKAKIQYILGASIELEISNLCLASWYGSDYNLPSGNGGILS